MKKIVPVEKYFCDICKKDCYAWDACDTCGKNICHDCSPGKLIKYTHSVWASGSGDGKYCVDCDQKLLKNGDKKHALYRLIKALRNENEDFYSDFKIRADKAEKEIKNLT